MELAYCGLDCNECPIYIAFISPNKAHKLGWQKSIQLIPVNFHKRICIVWAVTLTPHPKVSTRTIYRDANILSIAGIPITSQKGYGGGLFLLQGFSLDKSYFTQAEQRNIIQALQILKVSNYPDADKSLNKIAGLFSHNINRNG